jgi:hypothetical protein
MVSRGCEIRPGEIESEYKVAHSITHNLTESSRFQKDDRERSY